MQLLVNISALYSLECIVIHIRMASFFLPKGVSRRGVAQWFDLLSHHGNPRGRIQVFLETKTTLVSYTRPAGDVPSNSMISMLSPPLPSLPFPLPLPLPSPPLPFPSLPPSPHPPLPFPLPFPPPPTPSSATSGRRQSYGTLHSTV